MRWQSPHSSEVTTWPLFLPVACTPLWQMMQKPDTASGICVWSTALGGFQLITVWQDSHVSLVCG